MNVMVWIKGMKQGIDSPIKISGDFADRAEIDLKHYIGTGYPKAIEINPNTFVMCDAVERFWASR